MSICIDYACIMESCISNQSSSAHTPGTTREESSKILLDCAKLL